MTLDPNADWDPATKSIINSCVGPPYTCAQLPGISHSPRVVAMPVFDLELYMRPADPATGRCASSTFWGSSWISYGTATT